MEKKSYFVVHNPLLASGNVADFVEPSQVWLTPNVGKLGFDGLFPLSWCAGHSIKDVRITSSAAWR